MVADIGRTMTDHQKDKFGRAADSKRLWSFGSREWPLILSDVRNELSKAYTDLSEARELLALASESSARATDKLLAEQSLSSELSQQFGNAKTSLEKSQETVGALENRLARTELETERIKAELSKTQADLARSQFEQAREKDEHTKTRTIVTLLREWIHTTHRVDIPARNGTIKNILAGMKRLLILALPLFPLCLSAQFPPPVFRNSWSTNVPPRPVEGFNNLSVTNLGSGTNWQFYNVRPETVARLIDITNIASTFAGDAGGTNARQFGTLTLTNLSGTGAVTNVVSLSTTNSTSKPITNHFENGILTLYGLEAGANVTLTHNPSNIVIASSGGSGSLLTSNVVFVTMGGNDATGTRNRQDLPFRTMQAARLVMLSNDTMRVETGKYTNTAEIVINSNITIELVGGGELYMSVVDSNMFHWTLSGGVLYAPDWDFYGATSGPVGVGIVFWDQTSGGGIFSAEFRNIYTVTNELAVYYNGSSDRTYLKGRYIQCSEGTPIGGGNNQTNHIDVKRLFTGGSEADLVSTDAIILNGTGTWDIYSDSISSTNDDAINVGGGGKYNFYAQDIYSGLSPFVVSGAGTIVHVYGATLRSPFTHAFNVTSGTCYGHDCNFNITGAFSTAGVIFSGNGGTNILIGCTFTSPSQPNFEIGHQNGRIQLIATPFTTSEVSPGGIGVGGAFTNVSRLDNNFPKSLQAHGYLDITNQPGLGAPIFRLRQTNTSAFTAFTMSNDWRPTNTFIFSITNPVAGHVLKFNAVSYAGNGDAQIVLTNDTDQSGGGGLITNANQFGAQVTLTIKEGALLTNTLFYPSNLTGPAIIATATTAQVTNLVEWRSTNSTIPISVSSNANAIVYGRLDMSNAVAFRTNNIDLRLPVYQAFTNALQTNLVLQLTNVYEGVTHRIDAYGAGRLGNGRTNAWQLFCTVPANHFIYWPPGTTNGSFDVLVNSNQIVSFTFMGGLGSTNVLAAYRVLEGIGAN